LNQEDPNLAIKLPDIYDKLKPKSKVFSSRKLCIELLGKYLNTLQLSQLGKTSTFQDFFNVKYPEDHIENKSSKVKRKISLEDFELLKVIGQGCMGKVILLFHLFHYSIIHFIFSYTIFGFGH